MITSCSSCSRISSQTSTERRMFFLDTIHFSSLFKLLLQNYTSPDNHFTRQGKWVYSLRGRTLGRCVWTTHSFTTSYSEFFSSVNLSMVSHIFAWSFPSLPPHSWSSSLSPSRQVSSREREMISLCNLEEEGIHRQALVFTSKIIEQVMHLWMMRVYIMI